MDTVRPVFKRLLLAAIVIYVAGTGILLSDLCCKVGRLEMKLMHMTGECTIKH